MLMILHFWHSGGNSQGYIRLGASTTHPLDTDVSSTDRCGVGLDHNLKCMQGEGFRAWFIRIFPY